jgi:hypothetical protein
MPGKPKSRAPARRASVAAATQAAAAGDFVAQALAALERGEPDTIPDARLQQVLAAAVKLYAAKAERRGDIAPFREGVVTTTESVVTACALIRAADLNLFDVAMWFNRPPAVS